MKFNIKGLASIDWRILVGAVIYASFLVITIFGAKMEYFNATILLNLLFTVVLGFGLSYWIRYAKKDSRRTEASYFKATVEQYTLAAEYAHARMKDEGYVYPDNYVDDWVDCTEFAQAMAFYMRKWVYMSIPKQEHLGLGIEPFSYNKGGDRKRGHVCVECYHPDQHIHFDVYPDFKVRIVLSKKELKSAQWRNF